MKNSFIYLRCKIALMCLIMVLGLATCEDFLDVTPTSMISDLTAWTTQENADLYLSDCYAAMRDELANIEDEEFWTDNIMTGLPGIFSRVMAISAHTPTISTAWGSFTEYSYFLGIRKCNVFIENVTPSDLDDTWKKLRIAEARFLRAYYYSRLWSHFGGVPIITEVLNRTTQGDEIFRSRATAQETYKFIVDECAAIANDLPDIDHTGRASKGAALAVKGFCELFNASPLYNPTNDKTKWALAAATNKQVMDLNAYSLFPDLSTLFLEGNNKNNEGIFFKQHLGGTFLGGSLEGIRGPWKIFGTQHGYGMSNPTQELADAYFMANGLPITDQNSGYNPQDPYVNREKRFYSDLIWNGAEWAGDHMYFWVGLGADNQLDMGDNNEASNTGYFQRKLMDPKYAINGFHRLNSVNYYLYRYGEVLLSYAEAQNEAVGPDGSVYYAINQVRNRSHLPNLQEGLNQDQMREAIRHERRVELAFENKRWLDLIRWKTAEVVLNIPVHAMKITKENDVLVYTVVPAAGGGRAFYPNKNYLMPIPQSAMDLNKNLVQNPNY